MEYRDLWLFLLLSSFWGTAFVAIKSGLAYFPPMLFAAFRYDLAALLMFGYALVVADRLRPRTRAEWRLVLVSGVLMIAGYQAFLFVGEQSTSSAAAAVVVALSPVLTTAFARAILPDQRLRVTGVLGLALGLAGVALLADASVASIVDGGMAGELLVLCAVASFALGSVLTEGNEATLPVVTMEAWTMLVGAITLHVASPLAGETLSAVHLTPASLGSLLYLSVVASALGFLLYFDLHSRVGSIEINLVSYVAPAFAAGAGWLLLGEAVDVGTAGGFLLVVVGFLLVKRELLADALGRVRARSGT